MLRPDNINNTITGCHWGEGGKENTPYLSIYYFNLDHLNNIIIMNIDNKTRTKFQFRSNFC